MIQYIQFEAAAGGTHTVHISQIADIVPGQEGKASFIAPNGAVILTAHTYDDVINQLTKANILLDLRQ